MLYRTVQCPRPVCRMLAVVCTLMALVIGASAEAAALTAGVARVDLTPPKEMKAPLGGYGARMNKPAEGVHDRIFAKCLVVSDGSKKFALVTADMLGFAPPFKSAVLDRLQDAGWSADNVMLLASHSHASIEMNAINPLNTYRIPQIGIHNPELYEFTVANFAKVITEAEKSLAPVSVGTASWQLEGWNRNRRSQNTLTDHELTITRIDTADGEPLAALVNFTAHPTFTTENEMMFSADWPGYLQRTVESLIGRNVTVMYHNGAEGDQAPRVLRDGGSSRWESMERYGTDLGIETWKRWQEIKTNADVAFAYHREEIPLPAGTWHPDFMKTGGEEYGLSEKLLKDMIPRMFPTSTASVSVRVGDLVIVGIPGEMAAGLGLDIKRETALATEAAHPVIGGLADEWISYMLTPDEYAKGGYEASVSFYGPKLGPTIVEGALAGVRALKQ